jgi:hypothetical protein
LAPENGEKGEFEVNLNTLTVGTRPRQPGDRPLQAASLDLTEFLDVPKIALVGKVLTFQETEISHMKPFITPKVTEAGKKLLQFQLEGGDIESIWSVIQSHRITAYGMPDGQTFEAAWEFQLYFGDNNIFVEFSSACTQVVDWQEVGSLNIRVSSCDAGSATPVGAGLSKHSISSFSVDRLEKLIYEDDDVISECGLVLHGADGAEIIIAAGISPGSVSVAASFATEPFEPQFSLAACRFEPVGYRGGESR